MSTCLCSQCFPEKFRNLRTIIRHLKDDRVLLHSSGIVHSQQIVAHLQRCITANELNLSTGGYGMYTLALPGVSNSDGQFNSNLIRRHTDYAGSNGERGIRVYGVYGDR